MITSMQPGSVLLRTFIACLFAVGMAGCGSSEPADQGGAEPADQGSTDGAETGGPADPGQTGSMAETAAVLNPNLAGSGELAELPGMTAELADMVSEARPFSDMMELDGLVSAHMSEDDTAALYARMFIPLNLNSATDEEILLVPGVGDRMLHEFKEYRPYLSIAQWRREMGKYVDDAEVARMEQYVFVPIDLNAATDEEILAVPGVGERMAHEFREYRPYSSMEQFRREIGKYVDEGEVARLERYVEIRNLEP